MFYNDFFKGKSLRYIHRMRNGGPGHKLAISSMALVILSSLYFGKSFKNEYIRCGLAGVTSALIVEVSTISFSTLDINSKTTNNFKLREYFKTNGVSSLMKGFQPMIYGSIIGSLFYYSFYKKIKDLIK